MPSSNHCRRIQAIRAGCDTASRIALGGTAGTKMRDPRAARAPGSLRRSIVRRFRAPRGADCMNPTPAPGCARLECAPQAHRPRAYSPESACAPTRARAPALATPHDGAHAQRVAAPQWRCSRGSASLRVIRPGRQRQPARRLRTSRSTICSGQTVERKSPTESASRSPTSEYRMRFASRRSMTSPA